MEASAIETRHSHGRGDAKREAVGGRGVKEEGQRNER